jgi:hypothetical protein
MHTPSVQEQPNVTFSEWIFVESCGHYFIVGREFELPITRCSTCIVSLDVQLLSCRTLSGRQYQLLQPHAMGDATKNLLNFFRTIHGNVGIDATTALLNNPDLLYKSFHVFDRKMSKTRFASPYLQAMTRNPAWLRTLIETVTTHDVDPHSLVAPLQLNEAAWQRWKNHQLTIVSTETALRALILQDMIDLILALAVSAKDEEARYTFRRNCLVEILSIYEMSALLKEHMDLYLLCHVVTLKRANNHGPALNSTD